MTRTASGDVADAADADQERRDDQARAQRDRARSCGRSLPGSGRSSCAIRSPPARNVLAEGSFGHDSSSLYLL